MIQGVALKYFISIIYTLKKSVSSKKFDLSKTFFLDKSWFGKSSTCNTTLHTICQEHFRYLFHHTPQYARGWFVNILWTFYETFVNVYDNVEIYVLLNTLLGVLLSVGMCVARIIFAPLHEGTQIPILPSTGRCVLRFAHEPRFEFHHVHHHIPQRVQQRHTPTWGRWGERVWHPNLPQAYSHRTNHAQHHVPQRPTPRAPTFHNV